MSMLEDGTGTGFRQKVDTENRALVRAISTGPLEERSEDFGDAAFFYSTYDTGGTNEEVISIKNTETEKRLHITRMSVGSAVAQIWTLFEITSGTPAGTVLTYLNPNLASGVANSVVAFGNAEVTGTVAGDTITDVVTLAGTQKELFFEGSIILGLNDGIALTASADGVIHVTIIGFWD